MLAPCSWLWVVSGGFRAASGTESRRLVDSHADMHIGSRVGGRHTELL